MCGDSQCPSCGLAQGTLQEEEKPMFNVTVKAVEYFYEIEAKDEEEAQEIALKEFRRMYPKLEVEDVEVDNCD
jgi:hypothetical protein